MLKKYQVFSWALACILFSSASLYAMEEKPDEDQGRRTTINDLPNELVRQTMTYLSPKDLGRAGGVSKLWYDLSTDKSLWSKWGVKSKADFVVEINKQKDRKSV